MNKPRIVITKNKRFAIRATSNQSNFLPKYKWTDNRFWMVKPRTAHYKGTTLYVAIGYTKDWYNLS